MYLSPLALLSSVLCVQVTSGVIINSAETLSILNAAQDHGSNLTITIPRAWQTGCIDTPDWMGPGRTTSFIFSDCGKAIRQIKAKVDEYGTQRFNFLALGAQLDSEDLILSNLQTPLRFVEGKSSQFQN